MFNVDQKEQNVTLTRTTLCVRGVHDLIAD